MATREETVKMIEVMDAFVRGGKEVEWRMKGGCNWFPFLSNGPVWNWEKNDYRIKPAPREWWIVEGQPDPVVAYNRVAAEAKASLRCSSSSEVIHVREVLED